ncbi:Trp biosynthesis-associated membrane protein [Janibacter sp. YIM B02568]|uniref:Trp biosynthesis-associated membrane protein n=1 Tax=Janibacter endophyticus TaxID=2806261 RepID=UPI00194EAA00|nr:Trp biosynthesis-associated membrane protein [Janibacter endophyticus]MBM6546509.1 Trp biosynthesis-associated membrane protein [Janibacter endophyticus]
MSSAVDRLTRKPVVLLLAVLGALVALAASRGVWIEGTVVDIAGTTRAEATGTEAAAGLAGLALVGAAAAVAAVTSGRVGRIVAALALVAVVAAIGVLVGRVVLDPEGILGTVAGSRSGTSATLDATATTTPWPWVAALAVIPFALAALGALLAGTRWQALGASAGRSETDRTESAGTTADSSDWERLSEGDDPTDEDPDGRARTAG